MPASVTTKRKRSAIACVACHNRRVRCNVASQGIPCTNCAHDGTGCRIYGQAPSVKPNRTLQPRQNLEHLDRDSPPIPTVELSDKLAQLTDVEGITERDKNPQTPSNIQSEVILGANYTKEAEDQDADHGDSVLVPYHAGGAEGLDFIVDICAPDRPVKGSTYIINRKVHRREHLSDARNSTPSSFPPAAICDELIHHFFSLVYPFLPVIDAGNFLTRYKQGLSGISSLLLWSMFFSAASYVRSDAIKPHGFKSRKSFKEYCYQHAKAIYDAQTENDKTSIISSAILLAFWYVDLEDLDGCSHWLGIAINLCHSVGLHREPYYARVPDSPFSASKLSLWRRIWWSCYYRDAWIAYALGRPMRLHLDDSDLEMPQTADIMIDVKDLPQDMRDKYLPLEFDQLATLWITLLHISIKLEHVMLFHYRPRRPPLSLTQLELDYNEIVELSRTLPADDGSLSQLTFLHVGHLKCYFNAVIIALHRGYILATPHHLPSEDRRQLKQVAIQRSKDAAAGTTATLNALVMRDLIDASQTMLVSSMMSAMQIHFYEIARSQNLARQHASHNLNLHMMILSHLKDTFWAPEIIHKLFDDALNALESGVCGAKPNRNTEKVLANSTSISQPSQYGEPFVDPSMVLGSPSTGISATTFEELFTSFSQFDNLQCLFNLEGGAATSWDLQPSLDMDASGCSGSLNSERPKSTASNTGE